MHRLPGSVFGVASSGLLMREDRLLSLFESTDLTDSLDVRLLTDLNYNFK